MKYFNYLFILTFFISVLCACHQHNDGSTGVITAKLVSEKKWNTPDTSSIATTKEGLLIKYGRALVAHTSHYLGPNGIVSHTTNGMNCQNCHLDAGTKFYGNNYSAVASNYPKFRARSGSIETIEKRVNDCIERSLNGTALDSDSKELSAIVAYIKWVGSEVSKDTTPNGAGLINVPFLGRAANAEKGKVVFESKCISCHGMNGQGMKDTAGYDSYMYPPLWGAHSYNTGAGLFRLSRFAGYVKANMPFDAKEEEQKLSDEQAWDVAAYVNSQPHPSKKFKLDWPDISKKPFDHPFGPYADKFNEEQHKLGPWQAMISTQKK